MSTLLEPGSCPTTLFPCLETSRLVLRNLLAEDLPSVFAIYSNPAVTRCCDIVTVTNQREAAAVLQVFQSEFLTGSGVRWGITQKWDRTVIGTCGVSWYKHNRSALLSYDLNQDYWNRGIMTEAVQAVVRYTFSIRPLNRITATTLVDNIPSIRVLRRVGFREEGILRDWGYWKGQFKDLRCFSLLRSDVTVPPDAANPIALEPLAASAGASISK